jgi:hypothetical protein
MDIDKNLNKVGLDIITKFQYNIGDCLFDAIVYLLYYSITSIRIPKKKILFTKKISAQNIKSFGVS